MEPTNAFSDPSLENLCIRISFQYTVSLCGVQSINQSTPGYIRHVRQKVVLFQREEPTGELSYGRTMQLNGQTSAVNGSIEAFVFSAAMDKLFVSMASGDGDDKGNGGLVVLDVVCVPATPAPTPAPTTPHPTAAPTIPSMVPELVEVRLAAAVHGIDIVFELGLGSSGK